MAGGTSSGAEWRSRRTRDASELCVNEVPINSRGYSISLTLTSPTFNSGDYELQGMKRHPIIFPALLMLCVVSAMAQEKSDREEMVLRGPVQSVYSTENQQMFHQGMWVDDTIRASERSVFDTKGRILESRIAGSAQFAPRIPPTDYETLSAPFWTRVFDDDNRSRTTTYFNNDTTVSHYHFRKLNERGDVIEIVQYTTDPQHFQSRKTYEYDDRGRIVKVIEEERSDTGVRTTVVLPKYHTVRSTATCTYYTSDRKVAFKETVQIDTIHASNKAEMRIRYDRSGYDERGVQGYRFVQVFDGFNRRRKEQVFMLDHAYTAPGYEHEYNEYGECIVEIRRNILSMMQEQPKWDRSRFVYDSLGNVIVQYNERFTSYPGTGTPYPYQQDTVLTEVMYDHHGNWIHKTIRRTGADGSFGLLGGPKPRSLVQRREITYFQE
jgi:hypothetical protein